MTAITLVFRAINPSSQGPTTPLTIQTFTDSTMINVIDQDSTNAYTTIVKLPSLSPNQITVTAGVAYSLQQSVNLIFTITPSIVIPPYAIISVLLDNQFTVGSVYALNCFGIAFTSQSLSCNKSDNNITWQNGNIQYNAALASQYGLQNLIQTPVYSGTYLTDITIFSQTYQVLQTYSDYIVIQPYQMITINSMISCLISELSTVPIQKYTILNTTFDTQIAVPAGSYDPTGVTPYGRIEIQFVVPGWQQDLGTNLLSGSVIPCKIVYGLLPMTGLSLQCNIVYPDSSGYTVIVIRNFQEVEVGTTVMVHIPGILNPIAAAGVNINLVQYSQRVRIILNTLPSSSISTLNFQPQGGAVNGTATQPFIYSNLTLTSIFNLTFGLSNGFDLAGPTIPTPANTVGRYILIELPGYDTMFVPQEETVVCQLVTQYNPPSTPLQTFLIPCIQYPGVDWILLPMQPQTLAHYTDKPFIVLYNLKWPRYQYSGAKLKYNIINALGVQLEIKTLTTSIYPNGYPILPGNPQPLFMLPTVTDFTTSVILSPRKNQGGVGLTFEFQFQQAFEIPDGGSVQLTWPSNFQLDSSFPQSQFTAPQFYSLSTTKPLTFSVSGNVLTITNIKSHPPNTPFTIIATGIKTVIQPSNPATAQPFLVQSMMSGNLICQTLLASFDAFTYGSLFSPGYVIFQSITAFPNNQNLIATYSFNFILTNSILPGGYINLTFPTIYTQLPTPGVNTFCNVTGALTSYQSCILISQSYIITLDQIYESGYIILSLTNITNPGSGYTPMFTIQSVYDSQYLDISDNTLSRPRQLFISNSPNSVLVQQIYFYPTNEAENATYVFNIVPSTYITSQFIVIQFPNNYDNRLGDLLECGLYICTAKNKQLWVSGITDYTPLGSNPIVISVSGITNPNQNVNQQVTGQFTIGVLAENTYNYIDYTPSAGFSIQPAPGWSYLYNVVPNNLYSRTANSSYFFNITTINSVPLGNGVLMIDFPSQFDIPDGSVTCISATFSYVKCSAQSNQIIVTTNQSYSGIVQLNISSIPNPADQVTTDNMIVSTYDSYMKTIIEKSYINLDPWTFKYRFPGPLIHINGDSPITVERGTQTTDMYFKVDYPCALNLTYTGVSQYVYTVPSTITLSLTQITSTFRVSAPETTPPGTYYIIWTVSGEQTSPFYTPFKKSTVVVTNNKNVVINVYALNDIPIGGNSLDTLISMDYAPDLGIEILLTSSSVLILSTRSVQFIAGQNKGTFRVSCNATEYSIQEAASTLGSPTVTLKLSGINSDVYVLSTTSLTATFVQNIVTAPFITGIVPTDTYQTNTTLQLSSGEVVDMYFMVALSGTAQPPQSELLNQGPAPYSSTLSTYYKISIGTSNTASQFISGLRAQTPYVIYAIAEGRSGLYSVIQSQTFTTMARYNATTASLRFTQSYLNSAAKISIMQYIAFVLSLPTYKIIENTITDSSRLLDTSTTTLLNFYIISIPTSPNFPSPKLLTKNLQSQMTLLKGLVSNVDTTYTITAQEYTPYVPVFVTTPTYVKSDYTSCTVQGKLANTGYLYTICLPASQDTQSPTPIQILWGYNSGNLPQAAAFVEVSVANQAYNLTLSNLTSNTDYNIYMIAGSSHPGYPDISTAQSDVHLILCTTAQYPLTPILNINSAVILVITMMIYQ